MGGPAERQIETMISVLRADPGLAGGLEGRALAQARSAAVAPLLSIGEGPWPDSAEMSLSGGLGFLVVRGTAIRDVRLRNRHSIEFLGPGDLLRPWDLDEERMSPIPAEGCFHVIQRLRLAVLNREFGLRIGAWPELSAAIISRALHRARRLTYEMAAAQNGSTEERLWLILWHLADRWGTVSPAGVRLDLPGLTHDRLAALVGVRRPSVTLALSRMREVGVLGRDRRRHVLCLGAEEGLAALDR